MTTGELRRMVELWALDTPVKAIARDTGFSTSTVFHMARTHRDLFPPRKWRGTREERDQWADRYLSGELTARQVAERAGCSPVTVRNWARDRLSGRTAAWRAEGSVPIADAAAMWARGLTEREMADALGVTLACVKGVVRRHRDRFPYRYGREGA